MLEKLVMNLKLIWVEVILKIRTSKIQNKMLSNTEWICESWIDSGLSYKATTHRNGTNDQMKSAKTISIWQTCRNGSV